MPEYCLEPKCHNATQGSRNAPFFSPVRTGIVQREEANRGPSVSFRSPLVDEVLHTVSDVQGDLQGRRLYLREEVVVRSVFGESVDYSRVRILRTGIAPGTTPGNTIRLPLDFDIEDRSVAPDSTTRERPLNRDNAQLLVHEMTHVWQYQRRGPSYATTSLGQQAVASLTRGNRNFAYAYSLHGRESFAQFAPEQQAFIVENYYAMQRDQTSLAAHAVGIDYKSNHLGTDGFNLPLTPEERQREIDTELPLHEPLIRQMRQTVRPSETELTQIRQRSLMMSPLAGSDRFAPLPRDLQLAPAVNIFELTFPGL